MKKKLISLITGNKKKLPVVEIVSGVLVTAFVVACFFGGRSLIINQKSAPVTIVAAKEISTTEHLAKRPVPAAATMMMAANNEVAPAQADSIAVDSTTIVKKPKTKISKPVISSAQFNRNDGSKATLVEPVATISKKDESTVSTPEVTPDESEKQESEKKDIVQKTTSINSADQPEEKKKGLFKKIFGKKKKD